MAKDDIFGSIDDAVVQPNGTDEAIVEDAKVVESVPVVAASAEVSAGVIMDFDFTGLDAPGVIIGDIGLEVSRLPVEKARFTKDSRALVSILTNKVVAVKTHYRDNLGSYLCFSGKCCDVDGLSKVKYLFPVVVYDTDKRGMPVTSDISFRVLALGKDQYDDVKTLQELNGDITQFDLVVTCKDEKYQTIAFALAGAARWRKVKSLVAQTNEFWKANMKHLVKAVARAVTEADLMKSEGSDAVDPSAKVDYEEVFKD